MTHTSRFQDRLLESWRRALGDHYDIEPDLLSIVDDELQVVYQRPSFDTETVSSDARDLLSFTVGVAEELWLPEPVWAPECIHITIFGPERECHLTLRVDLGWVYEYITGDRSEESLTRCVEETAWVTEGC